MSGSMFASPLTPPPNGWLHDQGHDIAYNTPSLEPVLFSLGPAIGGAAAPPAQPRFDANLPTMRSIAGQAGSYPMRGPGALRRGKISFAELRQHCRVNLFPR